MSGPSWGRGAGPRPPGAPMLVGRDGSAVGLVSGGCVQGAVYGLAGLVVADGHPVLRRYTVRPTAMLSLWV